MGALADKLPPMRLLLPLALAAALCLTACSSTPAPDAPAPGLRLETNAPIVVGFVIVDGVYGTELTAPWDVFQHTQGHAPYGMQVVTVAQTSEAVTTYEGLRILPDHSFASCPPLDVLVVPSAEHSMTTDLENKALIEFVAERGAAAGYVMSLCDGAFVLAESGLLDGLQATTFPGDLEPFSRRYGDRLGEVVQGVSFVHHDQVITSVGGAPSFDAALYLCQLLYGRTAAKGVAKGLVIDWNLERLGHRVVPPVSAESGQ